MNNRVTSGEWKNQNGGGGGGANIYIIHTDLFIFMN